jgi:hypothetical protein
MHHFCKERVSKHTVLLKERVIIFTCSRIKKGADRGGSGVTLEVSNYDE